MRVVTVGDNCMDVYQAIGKAYPGGNPVNVAVYLKELGADTAYIGWVGTDAYGDDMIQSLSDKDINITYLSRKKGKTAVTFVELIENDRSFGEYTEGVMADFSLTQKELDFIGTQQLVHSGIWGHTDTYYPAFKRMGLATSFDFSDKLNHSLTYTLPAFVDYAFFSYTKDDHFIRQYLKKIKAIGSQVVIATLGENGAIAYDGEQFYKCSIIEKNVVDTMGAGDSFISGFIYGLLNHLSINKCLDLGTETAAKTIRYFGAW